MDHEVMRKASSGTRKIRPTGLAFLWSIWWAQLAAAVGVSVLAGLANAWLMPRGPVTTAEALASMAAAALVGLAAGLVMGSRWSMLIAPLAFAGTFELARMGVQGPTVDAIHLGSTYGIIAFAAGRFIHGLLALLPMMVGAGYGVWLAGRLGKTTAPRIGWFGAALTGILSLALAALAVAIALPARSTPVMGTDGGPLPGSVSELAAVNIGGHDQVLMIRGRSADQPVLLYLAGGPGGTDLGAMRADTGLEQDFVVVTWEQRGTGKSYTALDPVETLTLEQMAADTLDVTNYLRERFDEDKIYLAGNSWGTIPGILAVQQHPELYHAYVGTGQMVNVRATDLMFYEDTMAWAQRTGNKELVAVLRQNGLPPYENLLNYESIVMFEHDWNDYPELDGSKEMPFNLLVPENNLMDKVNGMRGLLDTFAVLYPQLQDFDFRQSVTHLDVPVYIVVGAHEARGRAVLAKDWYERLDAPAKQLVVFEHSGHRPPFEEPAAFAELMRNVAAAE